MDEHEFSDEDQTINNAELEERLTKLCQLHDGLCAVIQHSNDIWRFPLLILMGYGFFIITAQLYFFYCYSAGQVREILVLKEVNKKWRI